MELLPSRRKLQHRRKPFCWIKFSIEITDSSRDSSVGIALGYELDVRGFKSRQGLGIFFFTTASRSIMGPTQPPTQGVPGALSLGVKRPGREAGHSFPSNAEVKNAWSYISPPQYALMGWCSVKAPINCMSQDSSVSKVMAMGSTSVLECQ
jgi:hypothetical protein